MVQGVLSPMWHAYRVSAKKSLKAISMASSVTESWKQTYSSRGFGCRKSLLWKGMRVLGCRARAGDGDRHRWAPDIPGILFYFSHSRNFQNSTPESRIWEVLLWILKKADFIHPVATAYLPYASL